jgi:patatin-like phospholipase/acyl hydrolase
MLELHKPFRILSIDGGGIRGIIPGQVLVHLESKLQMQTNNPDARIADYFDLIAGTSTGGILTIAHLCPHPEQPGRPKYNASEVVDFYLKKGSEIFAQSTLHKIFPVKGMWNEKYSAQSFEKVLNEYFSETKLSELLKPCLIPSYDIERRRAHFFTQHSSKGSNTKDYLNKDVARATSAAPTYFEVAQIKSFSDHEYPLVDGGVFVNNPALCAFAESMAKFDTTPKNIVMLSLGTGFVRNPYLYEKAKNWGAISWIKPMIDIMMSGVADVVDYQLEQIFNSADKAEKYLRVNTEIPSFINHEMDDASIKNLKALRDLGEDTASTYDVRLDNFVKLLI